MANKVKAVLIGGTGYGGAEILRRLLFHPEVEVARVTAADNIGKRVGDVHLNLAGLTDAAASSSCSPARGRRRRMDVVFLAMPHKTTAKVVMEILDLRRADRRPLRGLPAARSRRYANAATAWSTPAPEHAQRRDLRLRDAGADPRTAIAQGQVRRLPGLLRHHHRPGPAAAGARRGCSPGPSGPWRPPAPPAAARTRRSPRTTRCGPSNLRTYKPLEHQHTPEIQQTLRAGRRRGTSPSSSCRSRRRCRAASSPPASSTCRPR